MEPGAGGIREVGGEREPAGGAAILQQYLLAWFNAGRAPPPPLLHLGGTAVAPHHGVAHAGECCGVHRTEVATADDGNFHSAAPSWLALVSNGSTSSGMSLLELAGMSLVGLVETGWPMTSL